MTWQQVKGKRSAKRQPPCSVTTFFNSLPFLCRVTWGLHLCAQSKLGRGVHANVPSSEAVDAGHTPGVGEEAVDAGHTPGVGEECMLEMKQCSSQDFSPTKQDINPAGRLAGGGGEEEEEEEEGDVRWIANWSLFNWAEDQRKQFLFIQDFLLSRTVCVDYITREKACQALKSMRRSQNGKRAEKCVKFLTSVHTTLVSKYLGVPVHVNDVKEMDEALPVYTKKHPGQETSKHTNKQRMHEQHQTDHTWQHQTDHTWQH